VCSWEVFFFGYAAFPGGTSIDLTWCTVLPMFGLKTLTTNLLNHYQVFSGGWHRFCTTFIRGLNSDYASPVAFWTLGALHGIGCALQG